MILFLLNYHNYLKIKWCKWYEYRWSIHSFHLDLGKEQYKKERKRNFIKTFISTITKVLLKYVLLSYTFPFKMDFSIQTCIKFALQPFAFSLSIYISLKLYCFNTKLYAPSDYHQAKIICAHGQKPEKKKQKGSQFLGEGCQTKGSFSFSFRCSFNAVI